MARPAPGPPAADVPPLRLGELTAMLALAQDHAFGQPPGSQLRACLLTQPVAEVAGLNRADAHAAYWLAMLRFLGCTGHAHEVAVIFGDEIAMRARSLAFDPGNPGDVVRELFAHGGQHRSPFGRVGTVAAMLAGGRRAAEVNFRTGCEVADALVRRLGFDDDIRSALGYTFERWNGQGFPNRAKGEAIPLPMRVVQLCQELEVLGRVHGPSDALAIVRRRSGRAYDPALVEALGTSVDDLFDHLDAVDPWDEVLAAEPAPHRTRAGEALDEALLTVADFADLKSPYTGGHSRGVADLAAGAARQMGMDGAAAGTVRHAGLVHDIGRVGVPNSVWDKPAALTRSERDRVETHALLTEQLLRHCPALAVLEPLASSHHERADGSGYHRRLTGSQVSVGARIVGVADCYQAMTEDRAHRRARSAEEARDELRALARDGRLDADAVDAVLVAAGHRCGRRRVTLPAGLTAREVEVLRLVALGLTTREISRDLVISAKTAEHHIEHIYTKIGVSTRGAAALFAIEHDLVRGPLG